MQNSEHENLTEAVNSACMNKFYIFNTLKLEIYIYIYIQDSNVKISCQKPWTGI